MLISKPVRNYNASSTIPSRINASARSNNNLVDCAQLMRGVGGGNFNNAGGMADDMTLKQFRKIVDDNIAEYFARNIDKK